MVSGIVNEIADRQYYSDCKMSLFQLENDAKSVITNDIIILII